MKDTLLLSSLVIDYKKSCLIVLLISSRSKRIIEYLDLISKLDIRFRGCFDNRFHQTTIINGKETTKPNFYNFFDTYHDPKTQEFYGEDFGFCKRWTDMGGKIYLYIMDYITHAGEYQYCGRMWDELQYNKRIDEASKKE